MAVNIFISYRRDDVAGHAGHIRTLLQPEFGADAVFVDVDSIPIGGIFAEVLDREVAKCDLLLALIGRDWLFDRTGKRLTDDQDDYPRIEIASALRRKITVIPVLLDGAMIPSADQLPDELRGLPQRQHFELRNSSFRDDVKRLIARIVEITYPPIELPIEFVGLRALIDSSTLPMYVTDKNFSIMIACNKQLCALLNCVKSGLERRPLHRALYYFSERVPLSRRERFIEDQIQLANACTSDLTPNVWRTEYIDNSKLHGDMFNGMYRVRMHSDRVFTAAGETIGFFVIYQLDEVSAIP
jgi:PAS domain-containing protein